MRLEMRHRLAARESAEHQIFLGLPVLRDDHPDRLADRFLGCVAEHPLRRPVPRRDDAVEVLADDGVVGGINDAREMTEPEVVRKLIHANGQSVTAELE
jgi:hypothetical protein